MPASSMAIHILSSNEHATYTTFVVERPDGYIYSVRQPTTSDVLLLRHWVASTMFLTDAQIVLVFQDRSLLSGTVAENGIVTGSKVQVLPVIASGGLVPRRRGVSIVVFGILGNEYLAIAEGQTSVRKIVKRMSDEFVIEFVEGNCSLIVQLRSAIKHLEIKVRLQPPALTSAELAAELDEECNEDTQLPLALRKGPVVEIINFRSSYRLRSECAAYLRPSVVAAAKDARRLMQVILADLLFAVPRRIMPHHLTLEKPEPGLLLVPPECRAQEVDEGQEQQPEAERAEEMAPGQETGSGGERTPAATDEGEGQSAAEPGASNANDEGDGDASDNVKDGNAEAQNAVTRGKVRSLIQRMAERRRQRRRDSCAPYGGRPAAGARLQPR